MADSDLTIVILRNIQAELVSINERLDLNDKQHETHRESFALMHQRFDVMGQRFDVVGHQLAHLDNRLTNIEQIAVGTATALGVDAQSSHHRVMRQEGELAELKVRVSALETIVKGKPTL